MEMKSILFIMLLVAMVELTVAKRWMEMTCKSNNDCKENEQCIDKKCKRTPKTDEIMNESFCIISKDCPALYYCNKMNNKCTVVSKVEHIMQKQACRNVFKKFCLSENHCGCNEEKMICEDNECVYSKTKRQKVRNANCQHHYQCPFLNVCDVKLKQCREAQNNIELMLLFTVKYSARKKDTH